MLLRNIYRKSCKGVQMRNSLSQLVALNGQVFTCSYRAPIGCNDSPNVSHVLNDREGQIQGGHVFFQQWYLLLLSRVSLGFLSTREKVRHLTQIGE